MELQKQVKESVNKLEIFVLCPGLSGEEIEVSFDKKEGILEIIGKPEENDLSELLDLSISGKISISPKYRSEEIKLQISKGIATIEFGLSKDVKLIKAEK